MRYVRVRFFVTHQQDELCGKNFDIKTISKIKQIRPLLKRLKRRRKNGIVVNIFVNSKRYPAGCTAGTDEVSMSVEKIYKPTIAKTSAEKRPESLVL